MYLIKYCDGDEEKIILEELVKHSLTPKLTTYLTGMKVIKGFPYVITDDDNVSGTCIATTCTGERMQFKKKRLHGNKIHSMECISLPQLPLIEIIREDIASELPLTAVNDTNVE